MTKLDDRIKNLEESLQVSDIPTYEESIRIDIALLVKEFVRAPNGRELTEADENYGYHFKLLNKWKERMGETKWKKYTKQPKQRTGNPNSPLSVPLSAQAKSLAELQQKVDREERLLIQRNQG